MPISKNKKKSKTYLNDNDENIESKKKNSNSNRNNTSELYHHFESNISYRRNDIEKKKEKENDNDNEMVIQAIPNKRKNSNSNSMSVSISVNDGKSDDIASSSNSSSAFSLISSSSTNQYHTFSTSLIMNQDANNFENKKNKNKYSNNNDQNNDFNESSYLDYFYDESEYSCNIEDIQRRNDEIMVRAYDHDNISVSSSNMSRKDRNEEINSSYDEEFESCEYNMSDNDCDLSFHSTGDYEIEEENNENDDDMNNNIENEEHNNNINNEEETNKMNDEKLQKEQSNIRKQIIKIQKDTSLTESEKARKIQELMTRSYNSKQKVQNNNITNYQPLDKVDYDRPLTEEEKAITYHNKEKNILGCKHYQRALKIQAHCCGKWFPCRFCHDEVSDHSITSKALTVKMMCMYCSTVQPVNDVCINPNCGKRVARYYCSECKLWDNDPNKNIYHCYDCGICRIGKGLGIDYFHCKTCNVCMSISLKGHHKCIERNLESNCPICGEYMFTSTTTVIFMPCGHCIHHKCYKEYIQTSYQCPTCFKSLANMTEYFKRIDQLLAQQKMPEEYRNWKSYILCNDCEKKSYTKFHFIYHKCAYCSSYNTKLIKTFDSIEAANLPTDILNNINNDSNGH